MKKQLTKMDFWVLAVVLALIVGVFVKFRKVDAMPDPQPFSYQMELTAVDGEIVPGDRICCLKGKQPMGTVTEVRPEGDRLVLTLTAEGFPIEGGWRTLVYDVLPGLEDDFYAVADDIYTKKASCYGIVISVS